MKRKLIGVLSFNLLLSLAVCAQGTTAKLMIGDKAPELRYGKWLKGTPVKTYESGRLYVVEFWATWCGPCISAMPHLSELAKKRANEVTIIGANIWEGKGGDSSKPYDSFLPKVEKFVNGMGDKMAYSVMMDDNSQFMGNNWMKAAGQGGIPTSFIIKDGIIQWIGHPVNLDSVLTLVGSGNYDVAAVRKAAIERSSQRSSGGDPTANAMKSYQEALNAKDFNKALKILDDQIGNHRMNAAMLSFYKFQTLFENIGEDSAMVFLRKWQKEYGGVGFTNSIGAMIVKKPGLKKDTYLDGINLLQQTIDSGNSIPPLWYNFIAEGYANMGDYKAAVGAQEKAVNLAKEALKEGKYAGFILEDTLKQYEETSAAYKKKLK